MVTFGERVPVDRLDRELDEEQRFHIETRADELEAGGLSRQAALDQAERQFGPRLQLRESSRDARLMSWLESLSRDLLFGLRLLRKDSLVSLAAILSLGLAIGACTAAFSLIDALILRQLPVANPQRLVYLRRPGNDSGNPSSSTMTNYPFFEHVRQTTSSHMEAFSMSHQSLRQAVLPDAGGVEEKLQTQFVSGNAFVVLGVRSAIGRVLAPSDDVTPGAHPVAVVSHTFWRGRLGGNPTVLGQWIRIEQKDYQIVGVTQAGFVGAQPGILTDIWLPKRMRCFDARRSTPPSGSGSRSGDVSVLTSRARPCDRCSSRHSRISSLICRNR